MWGPQPTFDLPPPWASSSVDILQLSAPSPTRGPPKAVSEYARQIPQHTDFMAHIQPQPSPSAAHRHWPDPVHHTKGNDEDKSGKADLEEAMLKASWD